MTYFGVEPLAIARASAALAAAGAWDAAPTTIVTAGADRLTLFCNYTRGAAGGAVDIQILASPYSLTAGAPAGAAEWVTMTIYDAGAVVAGADTQSLMQREYLTYTSQAAAAEAFTYGPLDISGIERIQVRARESGVVGTPGTCQIQTFAESEVQQWSHR